MRRTLNIVGACGVMALVTTGCLVKETAETWYLGANGEVTWVMTEKDVRSDANAALDRQQEEGTYWLAVQQQRHPAANGFQELGGTKIRTLVLRGESPYTVRTEARFAGLDELGRRVIAATGAVGTSIVTQDGTSREWTFVVRDPSALMSVNEPSDNVAALLNDLESLHIVLAQGRFESADGFTLSSDQRIATFITKNESHDHPEEPAVTLRLRWK